MRSESLLELVSSLPAGTLLCSTEAFQQATGKHMEQAYVSPTLTLIVELGYQGYLAELSEDRNSISLSPQQESPFWPAFLLTYLL